MSFLRIETTRLAAAIFLMACSAEEAAIETTGPEAVAHVYRVAGGDSLLLYVFAPAGLTQDASRSAVLLFHGGGWAAGSADWTFGTARAFAREGLVAISVQYRLSGGDWTPLDALSDVCEAVRWVRHRARDFGIDAARVAGYGVSAGGHLIASTATAGCPVTETPERSAPDLLLLWSPALDVTVDGWFERQLQGRAAAEQVSPAQHVHAATPPTSIVHGDKDTLTPLSGARRYCDALAAQGIRCELNVYPGVGHLLTRNLANQESDFDPDPAARADGIEKHMQFLRSNGF